LIHALDIFLGIHKNTHTTKVGNQEKPYLERMKLYTPRHHQAFLNHLEKEPQLRDLIESAQNAALTSAYNEAIRQMKLFRDQHIRIVTLYIISPAGSTTHLSNLTAKGTGGTVAIPFLKSVRDQTINSLLTS
jgi:indoleamine 2,3-dioxygenase